MRIPRRRVHRGLGTNRVAVVFKGKDQVPGGVRRALWAGGRGGVLMEGFTQEVVLELRCRVE